MNQILKCNCKLKDVLRDAIPVEGRDFVRMIQVHLKAGEFVIDHKHSEHVAIYYPADAEPVTVWPTAGMIIYLPPGTQHAVPKIYGDRVSVAMLVESNLEGYYGTR